MRMMPAPAAASGGSGLLGYVAAACIILTLLFSSWGVLGGIWLVPVDLNDEDYEVQFSLTSHHSFIDTSEMPVSCQELQNIYSDDAKCNDDILIVTRIYSDDCDAKAEWVSDIDEVCDLASAGTTGSIMLWIAVIFSLVAAVIIIFKIFGIGVQSVGIQNLGRISGITAGTVSGIAVLVWHLMIPHGLEGYVFSLGLNFWLTIIGAVTGIVAGFLTKPTEPALFFSAPQHTQFSAPHTQVSMVPLQPVPSQPVPMASQKPPAAPHTQVSMVPLQPVPSQPAPMVFQPLPAEHSIEQQFSVGELIAEGGMAQVFRATKKLTGQTVIWKQAYSKHNPLFVSNRKLNDEVKLLKVISHHRIPSYLEHGEITDEKGDVRMVLVQEFIEGGDLKNTVDQFAKVGALIPLAKVLEYLEAVCEPLEYMASLAEPVYHRDLKPHNIIVHPDRGPVLIDFGLAKMITTGEDVSITRGGSGTWTPPERDAGVSGSFTDVYSLGKTLFFLLTNETPPAILDGDNVAIITTIGHPQWLADMVLRAAWPQHVKRIQTVQQFRILLQNEGVWPEGVGSGSRAEGADDYTTWS